MPFGPCMPDKQCPDCDYADVRTFADAGPAWMLAGRCRRHQVAPAGSAPPGWGVSAAEAVRGLRAIGGAASGGFVDTYADPSPIEHLHCCPARRPWLRRRQHFRSCKQCPRRWCWDAGQWRKVLMPREIEALEKNVGA